LLETAAITTQPLVALRLRPIEYPVTFEFVLIQLNWIALLEMRWRSGRPALTVPLAPWFERYH